MKEQSISHYYVLATLDYDPDRGVFTWKASRRPGHNGKIAGKIGGGTYRYATVGLAGKNYGIARLAWFYVHGRWPAGQLRFANGDPSDARLANLREHEAKRTYKQGKPPTDNLPPVDYRARNLKMLYGLTLEDYAKKLSAQKGVCAICEQPETRIFRGKIGLLNVDHDHSTGQIRDLLCNACNVSLGGFRDSPELLERAASYLRRHVAPDNVVPLKTGYRP